MRDYPEEPYLLRHVADKRDVVDSCYPYRIHLMSIVVSVSDDEGSGTLRQ